MTFKEVLDWSGNRGTPASSATGRYQFMRQTLQGLQREMSIPDGARFTSELQDRMALQLLNRRGYQDGDGHGEKALNAVGGVFLSLMKQLGQTAVLARAICDAVHSTPLRSACNLRSHLNRAVSSDLFLMCSNRGADR